MQTCTRWKIFSNCFINSILDAVPGDCELCGQRAFGLNLCTLCIESLPRTPSPCPRCGLAQLTAADAKHNAKYSAKHSAEHNTELSEARCGFCAVRQPAIDQCISLLSYEAPVKQLVSRFKFHEKFATGRSLSLLLTDKIKEHYEHCILPEGIIPVPLHPSRWRQRGYNQAMEIGRVISQELQIRLATNAVQRIKATEAQTTLTSSAARRRNLAGAFAVKNRAQLRNYKHIAIVDDVITTMSTIDALAKLLRKAGVERIDAWSLARAQR